MGHCLHLVDKHKKQEPQTHTIHKQRASHCLSLKHNKVCNYTYVHNYH